MISKNIEQVVSVGLVRSAVVDIVLDMVPIRVAFATSAPIAFLVAIAQGKCDEFAVLATGAYPAILDHKTPRCKGEDPDDFTFVGGCIESVDLEISIASYKVDVLRRGQPYLGSQLPVSGNKEGSDYPLYVDDGTRLGSVTYSTCRATR